MAKKEEKVEKESAELTPEQQLKSFLKANVDDHFNYEASNNYKVSSGSIKFDAEIGGIKPGITRMLGISEGGKTSSALAFLNNFLKESSDEAPRRGLVIKAEGRLDESVKERSGITFVEDAEKWQDGTCFVLKSNIFETVITLCRNLIHNNPTNTKYFMIFDSMDALIAKEDMAKGFSDPNKVASNASISTNFLKKMALSLTEKGHIGVLISQMRSQVSIGYVKSEYRIGPASGGHALSHHSNEIFEFLPRFKDDLIMDDTGKKIIGHHCKIKIDKSTNEKTGTTITYPIKYGRKNGTSVWIEYEIAELLIMWEFLKKKGAWLSFDPDRRKEIQDHLLSIGSTVEVPEQIQGQPKLFAFLESNPEVTKFLYEKFKTTLSRA